MADYLKLTKEETFDILDKFNEHYAAFNDIEAYYRYKKRKRLEDLPTSLSLFGVGPEEDLFNDPDLEPKDMEFEVVTTSDKAEEWNGTSWTEVADLTTARVYPFGIGAVNTAVLCCAGNVSPHQQVETYDGTSWTEVADLATARASVGSAQAPTMTNTSGLAIGGYAAPVNVVATEEWADPVYTIKTVTVS